MASIKFFIFILFMGHQAESSYNQDCSSYINKNNWFGFVFCITQRCPDANAEFVDCGVRCSQTCEYNRNQPISDCHVINNGNAHQCVQRCVCKRGYVKESEKFNAPCVPANQCPQKCSDPNAYYSECGSRCVEACGAIGLRHNCSPACAAGCFCKTGYVKESNAHNARCIPKSTCSAVQNLPSSAAFRLCPDPNAEYSMCGSECSAVCGKSPPKYCSMRCVEGCYCRPGHVKLTNAPDSPCITNDQCSAMTSGGGSHGNRNLIPSMPNLCVDSNARYLFWGPLCWPTCEGIVCSGACTAQPNCFCKDGYVKSSSSDSAVCVPVDQCRRQNFISGCMNNNQGHSCSNSCSQFCNSGSSGNSLSPPSNDCLSTNVQMCQCISSFNRQSAHCLFPCPSRLEISQIPLMPDKNDPTDQIEFCDCKKCSHHYAMVNPYCAARCKCFVSNVPQHGNNNIDQQQHCNCYDCASENARMTPYCFSFCGCRIIPISALKPGQCPSLGPNPGTSQRKDQCKQDSDCDGSAKCCDTWAGHTCFLP